jgi:hypothetical protein
MSHLLNQVSPPALPLAREQYDRPYQDQLNNVLRLYFRQLNTTVNTLVGDTGGRFLQTPYAAVQRTTDKTFTANTATQITFNQNDYLNGCANDGTDGITVSYNGLYNYQFSIQFANTASATHTAWVWLRKNGVDIPGTGSKFDVPPKHGSSDGYLIAACNFYVDLLADDTVEMWAAVENTSVYMEAYAAQVSPFAMPAIPSVVATLSFVSAYGAD